LSVGWIERERLKGYLFLTAMTPGPLKREPLRKLVYEQTLSDRGKSTVGTWRLCDGWVKESIDLGEHPLSRTSSISASVDVEIRIFSDLYGRASHAVAILGTGLPLDLVPRLGNDEMRGGRLSSLHIDCTARYIMLGPDSVIYSSFLIILCPR
jgi:hypothetical protein